jgi:hypothetical protein
MKKYLNNRYRNAKDGSQSCPCGNQSIKFKSGGPVCKRCDEIEDKMAFDNVVNDSSNRSKASLKVMK